MIRKQGEIQDYPIRPELQPSDFFQREVRTCLK